MFRLKKILAIIYVLIFTVCSVGVVTADEVLKVTYLNADSTKIMIDFSHEVDVNELADAITLTMSGNEVSFTVEAKDKTVSETRTEASNEDEADTTVSYGTAPAVYPLVMTANTDYSYVIIPDDGITLDAVYVLTIGANLQDSTHTVYFEEESKHYFKVNKLWIEDFNSYADLASTPWMARGGSPTTSLVTLEDGNQAYQVVKSGAASNIIIAPSYKKTDTTTEVGVDSNFADTGVPASTYWAWASTSNNSDARKVDDYNLELSLRLNTNADMKSAAHGILICMTAQQNGSNMTSDAYNSFKTAGIGVKSNAQRFFAAISKRTAANTAKLATISDEKNSKTIMFDLLAGQSYASGNDADATTSVLQNSDLSDSDYTNDNVNKISMSVLEDDVRLFANDNGFISYKSPIDLDYPAGYPELGFLSNGNVTTTYIIDDIIATKFKEVAMAEYTMTPEDGATDVEIGNKCTLTFDKNIDPASLSNDTVKVYKNGELFSDYTLSIDETSAKVVNITFNKEFEYNTVYKVSPEGVKFENDTTDYEFEPSSFHTMMPEIEISDFSVDKPVDMSNLMPGTYNVNATFKNNKKEEKIDAVMTICLYDSNYRLINVSVKEISVSKGGEASLSSEWTISEEGEYIAKCYVWNNFEDLVSIEEKELK